MSVGRFAISVSTASSVHPERADLPVLDDGQRSWSAGDFDAEVCAAAAALKSAGTQVLATLLDNSAAFAVLDEAALQAGVVHVPLPLFFTPAQCRHALLAAGVDTLVAARAAAGQPGLEALPWQALDLAGQALVRAQWPAAAVERLAGTVKITFTSGTTGDPKGVCLGAAALDHVADGLVQALAPLQVRRHLSALPYAVLLENIAGLMAPRRAGATVLALPLSEIGLTGSSGFDAARFQATLVRTRPDSVILLPQMLRAWVGHLMHTRQRAPDSLKIVAVGGAAVGASLVQAAQALGIPACEGYGLSEGASVQTLNLPGVQRPGSAGRVLPHARIRVSDEGEIEIAGSLFLGYLGHPAGTPLLSASTATPAWYPTGDLGRIDGDGYLHITGRRKHVLITSYGRNVSPEWIETALRQDPNVLQAVVFGDGEPALSAVLWPVQAAETEAATEAALQASVDRTNAGLPDYARIARWTRGRAAYDPRTGLATANGRPQRAAIWQAHADALVA